MDVITEESIRKAVREPEALEAAELAFRALGTQSATVPAPLALKVAARGELHVKAGYLHGSRFFVVKAATGFYDNPHHGLPSGSGLMLIFDATLGFPIALLQDNGYLTELRTAAAGTLATRLLAIKNFERIAVIGAGAQARYHLRAFQNAFRWKTTFVWARDAAKAQSLCDELRAQVSCDFVATSSAEAAVREADVVVTVTPSKQPVIRGEWLQSHATVIAVGSDEPDKRELDSNVFRRADRVVVDSIAQCSRFGELHHAVVSQITSEATCIELGEVLVGKKVGRTDRELIVCDLTGLGAQDAAIAELAYRHLSMADSADRD
jgi:ornithine cyclodeaminase/alanine dehydrogenase-like protein (mu-crystallin family)